MVCQLQFPRKQRSFLRAYFGRPASRRSFQAFRYPPTVFLVFSFCRAWPDCRPETDCPD